MPRPGYIQFRPNEAEQKFLEIVSKQEGLKYHHLMRLFIREAAQLRGMGPIGLLRDEETKTKDKPLEIRWKEEQ